MSVSFSYAARSNLGLGTKSRNEDSAYAGPELLVLCDGMGGHAAGDVASSLVVGELVHLDGESHGADDALDVLEQAIAEANARLAEVSEESRETDGMGTTCIAMLRSGSKLAVANIGDSRAYLRRATRVTQITKDHSFVQKLLDEGRISPEEAQHHPQRSMIMRVLTGREDDRPDLSMRELREGDRIMICSDGLTDYVAEDTVTDLLRADDLSAGQCAEKLIELALKASTRDNVTVIVADVVASGDGTTKPQVVGAASKRRGMTMIAPQTPAEKAAALSRSVQRDGDDDALELDDDGESRRPAVMWLRRGLIALAILAVVATGGWLTYDWSQRQYYVGESAGYVTVFRGVSQDLGPISLSEAEETTDILIEALPAYYRERVVGTLSADNRAGADVIVDQLRLLSLPRCADLQPRPTLAPDSDSDTATATATPDADTTTATATPDADTDTDATTATATPDDTTATAIPDVAEPAPVPGVDCQP